MVQLEVDSVFERQKKQQADEPTFPEEKRWHPLTVSKIKGLRSGGAGRWDCDKDCFTFLISTRHKARSSPSKQTHTSEMEECVGYVRMQQCCPHSHQKTKV